MQVRLPMKTSITLQVWQVGVFSLLGAIVGAMLWGASSLLAAGGHGMDIGFMLSFPYSEVLHRIHPGARNTLLLRLFAWGQWPFYGLVVGLVWGKGPRTLVSIAILVLHLFAVACCLLPRDFYESFW